ncbi:MAG: VWA domain-containing protein [Blastocatellia bacterium]|nr:VWA domain-containing protein [Blastocatellia bacterium]
MFAQPPFSRSSFRSRWRQFMLWLLLSLLIASALPLQAWAYEGDHYSWTYYLALHVGYTKRQAFQIASGAYAIDWDPDTGPMEATPGDAIYGAGHPGLTGTSHPQIAGIWTKFHAFAETNYVGVGNEVEKARQQQKDILWALARAQRNPGPLVHFTQDYYSHFEFDNVRGHAVLGHKPDFISNDPHYKARSMTKDTITVLQRFLREVLGGTPKEPDYARLWEVLDRVAAADPVPNVLYPGNFNPNGGTGSPSLSRSMGVVNRAIEEDEAAGKLPKFPEIWFGHALPAKWYQYGYDTQGKVNDTLYAVEKARFEPGKEQVEITPINENNFRIKLRFTYKLTGLLDLKDGSGSPFLSPLPVYEKHVLSNFVTDPKVFRQDRRDGEYTSEIEIQRGRSELEQGVTWICTIHAYGFEPVTRQVKIPVPADTKAAQDCKALLAQAQQLLTSGDAEQAARLLAQAQQKCGSINQNLTDQLNQTQKQLEEQVQKLSEDAQQNINKCEYEEALRQAERLRQINPNHPWLVNALPQLQPQAEAQHKARELLRIGLEAIQRKDIDGAIASLRQARGVAGVPQCLLNQINKLLAELELRKRFIVQTEQVEQATIKCDYKEAVRLVGDIARITPREQYITDWMNVNVPKLGELQNRERRALQLINQADALATQAEAEATKDPLDANRVAALAQQTMQLLTQADQEAPKCMSERKRMEEIRRRLAALANRKKTEIAASIALLIDTSGSMGDNNKINQAKDAARRAARQASKTTEIAVLNFDGGCGAGAMRVAAGFTSDVNALLAAIDKLQPGGGTPMYIATAAAVKYAQDNGRGKQRTVVLMSDGGDSCRDQQAQAAAAIRSSNIPVSTIGFDVGNNQQAQGDLGNLATMTGGRTFSASAADPREIIRAFNLAMLPSLLKDFDFGNAASNVAGYFSQAKAMVQQQNVSGALMLLQQANQLAPNSPNLNFNLSLLYESEDQLIPAMNHANNYLRLAPGAVDRADVENRIGQIQKELQANPRVVMDSSGCRDVSAWAQAEQDVAKRGRDVARRQAVLEVLIAAQRGDCENARKLQTGYKQRFGGQ